MDQAPSLAPHQLPAAPAKVKGKSESLKVFFQWPKHVRIAKVKERSFNRLVGVAMVKAESETIKLCR